MARDSTWKRRERETARALGAERLANSGHGQPDILAGVWAIEHKSWAKLPALVQAALDQAQRNCPAFHRPAVIVAARDGQRVRRVVILDLWDFQSIVTGAFVPPVTEEE